MLTKTRQDVDSILSCLRSSPAGMTTQELAQETGIDKKRVHAAVRIIIAMHLVEAHKDPTAKAGYRRSRYVHVAHTRSTTPSRALSWRDGGIYKGEDWASACSRPGCLDHEQYGSRHSMAG